MKELTIGLVGNPNCGKTTLFNRLTGARQRVGIWPGVTVDRKSGSCRCGDRRLAVIDTPGIYALAAASLDEQVTRDFLLSGEADVVVNIVDATNIERNLYLTSQLIEMRVPRAQYERFQRAVARLPWVLECHHVSGAASFVLKCAVPDVTGLELLVGHLSQFGDTSTSLVMSTVLDRREFRRDLRPAARA